MIVRHFVCPKCEKTFRAGPEMRLGPGQAQCGICDSVLSTGLKNWNEFTAGEKVLLVIKELLDPYSTSNPLEWIYMHLMMSALMTALGLGIVYLLTKPISNPTIMVVVAVSAYPAMLIVRLIRRIVICKQYAKTGKPPVWR